MKKLLIAAAMATTAIAGAAVAAQADAPQRGHRGHSAMFKGADANNDGVITRTEFLSASGTRFANMDKNHDGTVSGDETRRGRTITKADFMTRSEKMFTRLDANKDGKISADEMKTMMERMRSHRGNRAGGKMHRPGGPMARGHHHHGDMLARVDANKDGRVSRDEMRAKADQHFAKLDSNHDGFIDKPEMDAKRAKMMERMKAMRGKWHRGPGQTPPPPPAPGGNTPQS